MKTFCVVELGCKVNSYEAESIAQSLEERGYQRVSEDQACDACIVFTCMVTNTAAQKSRKVLHRCKRENPNCILVAVGCYVQVEADALKGVDILVGSSHKAQIPEYIEEFEKNHVPLCKVEPLKDPSFEPLLVQRFELKTRAYLRIQDGCNQYCSYCVIPFARGKERSMDPELVILEAKRLAQTHHEIVLAGIHTGRYGKEYGIRLSDLMLRILTEVPSLQRLRISSIESTEVDDAFIELMQTQPRIARHLHIPLQSGSDAVLKRMNRPYTTQAYYDRIKEIQEKLPGISISTDLIVGFPQESEEEFEETKAFLKKCAFSFLHVFPYSARTKTVAAMMSGQVEPAVKKTRVQECLELSKQLYQNYQDQKIGKPVEVLVETRQGDKCFGHSSEYLPITISQEIGRGEMVKAVCSKRNEEGLEAERV